MKAYIGDEHIQINVPVIVPHRKAHPSARLVDAHTARHRREAHARIVRIVAVEMQPIGVICHPQIRIAVVVIVKEQDCVRLPGGFAHAVALLVGGVRVVSLINLIGLRILIDDRGVVRVAHKYLRALNARFVRRFGEGEIAVVDVQRVVVSWMIQILEVAKVLVHQIAHEQIQPAVAVHIGACDAGRGARVNAAAKRRRGDVRECAVAAVPQQRV